jgi:diguanylate cyclase (GGDEF)-like protein
MYAMESAASVVEHDRARLRLEEALQLLRQAGQEFAPQGGAGGEVMLQRVIDGLCDLTQRDSLTGLANARAFRLALDRELGRAARTGEAAAVLLLDVDHLKRINDAHGRMAGDEALRVTARTLAGAIRPMDLVVRYGSDEFAVMLANCGFAAGRRIAERLRQRVAATTAHLPDGKPFGLSVSIGGGCLPPWERTPAESLLEMAYRHLYTAKHQGRNCVSFEYVPSSRVSNEERAMLFVLPGGKRS